MKSKFLQAVLPSMLAFAFSGLYSIIDGLFVGRGVGDQGLAAINFAYPLVVFIQAVGTGIGMGGAVFISISRGSGEREQGEEFLGNTVSFLLLASVIITLLLCLLSRPLLLLLGADGAVLSLSYEYMRLISLGAVFQIIATGLTPILRNYDRAFQAMLAMIVGFLTNIFFDWLFVPVLGYGMAGAALATVIGQAVTCIPCLAGLKQLGAGLAAEKFRITPARAKKLILTGISPFGLSMSPYIVVILMNMQAMRKGGGEAVAAYAVIGYVSSCLQLLLQGVGDGAQPLMSYYYGLGRQKEVKAVRQMAYLLSGFLAVLATVLFILLRSRIPALFGSSKAVSELVKQAMPIYAAGFLLTAFLRISTSYFYATKQNGSAYGLIFSEPLLIFFLLFYLLHPLALTGVWLTVPLAQLLLSVTGIILLRADDRADRSGRSDRPVREQGCSML